MRGRSVQGNIDAVLVPERIVEPHRHIVDSFRIYGEIVCDRAFIAKRSHAVLDRHDTGRAGIIAAVMVDDDIFKLGFLLFAVSGQIVPSVICPTHLRIGIAVGIPSFHVIVHMRERPRYFVVIVPISHERDERLRRLIVREVIHAFEPVLRGIVGL